MGGEWEKWGRNASIYPSRSAFVNGMLHLVVYIVRGVGEMIVTIDVEGKISRMIRWPKECDFLGFVGQSQGHLHCMSEDRDNDTKEWVLSIWVLEDYDSEGWVLKHSVSLLQLFGSMSCPIHDLTALAFMWARSSKVRCGRHSSKSQFGLLC
uniref:F-box associated domain-containing protein n=1 Tax=Arundo donax TaxID=35708 RepID=A0A0A8XX13_ARUDO